MPDNAVKVPNQWAVIQTGSILPNADVVSFRSESGDRIPVVLYSHEDEVKVRRMRKRILARSSKINGFNQDRTVVASPVLGVIQLFVDEPVKREIKATAAPAPPVANGVKADAKPLPVSVKK